MNYYVFKEPRKPNDRCIKQFRHEPAAIIVHLLAVRNGPITILSEEDLKKEKSK